MMAAIPRLPFLLWCISTTSSLVFAFTSTPPPNPIASSTWLNQQSLLPTSSSCKLSSQLFAEGGGKKIIVLGGDGFCGWPTSLHLSDVGHDVVIVDNLSRRKIDLDLGCDSLTPIQSPEVCMFLCVSLSRLDCEGGLGRCSAWMTSRSLSHA
jgi:hypothetical protein